MSNRLLPEFMEALPPLLEKTAAGLRTLLASDITLTVEEEEGQLRSADAWLTAQGPGTICCRAACVLGSGGVVGLLVPAAGVALLAAQVAAAAGGATPLSAEESIEALEETWDVFVSSWNRDVADDQRLSAKPEERAVERYPVLTTLPPTAGLTAKAVALTWRLGENSFSTLLFPSRRAFDGATAEELGEATEFVSKTVDEAVEVPGPPPEAANATPPENPAMAAPMAETDAAQEAPATLDASHSELPETPVLAESSGAAPPAPAAGTVPLVFLDYTGALLAAVSSLARHYRCLLTEDAAALSLSGEEAPLAVITVNCDPHYLQTLAEEGVRFIELHPQTQQAELEQAELEQA